MHDHSYNLFRPYWVLTAVDTNLVAVTENYAQHVAFICRTINARIFSSVDRFPFFKMCFYGWFNFWTVREAANPSTCFMRVRALENVLKLLLVFFWRNRK